LLLHAGSALPLRHVEQLASTPHCHASAQHCASMQLSQAASAEPAPHLAPMHWASDAHSVAHPVVHTQVEIAAYFVRPATFFVVQSWKQASAVQPR
jgi:hypothetical protein